VVGDLGKSVRTNNPVAHDLARFMPASAELMLFALLIGIVIGVGLGVVTTLFQRAGPIRIFFLSGASCPIFLLALLLSLLLWFELGWLPSGGRLSSADELSGPTGFYTLDGFLLGRPSITLDALWHLILPAFCLSLPITVAVGRTLQASLFNVMRQNYIRTAYSKGLSKGRVVFGHALRNAVNAPLAMIGLQFGLLFTNLLIVERIFAWPGLGLYTVQAFSSSDLPAVLGVVLIFGTVYIAVTVLLDLLQTIADPRVALS
jgi:peptide/nickel transport system permease protein/dipeptide transport system permease protein